MINTLKIVAIKVIKTLLGLNLFSGTVAGSIVLKTYSSLTLANIIVSVCA